MPTKIVKRDPEWRRRGSVNAPEREDPTKKSLLSPLKRVAVILKWRFTPVESLKISIMALQESGSVFESVVDNRKSLQKFYASPDTIIHSHRIGKGFVVARNAIEILDRDEFKVKLAGRARRLAFPVMLVADRKTGHRSVEINIHLPRNVDSVDPGGKAREAILTELRRRCAIYVEAGLPVVVYGDFNGPAPKIPNFKVAVKKGPDAIIVSGFDICSSEIVELHGASDHEAVSVMTRPRRLDTTTKKLPK